jgi:DNA-3-methyladenine glycosylase II
MRKHIRHLKNNDPILGAIIDKLGIIQIAYREPTFESLVRSIVFQQLSGKVARVIYERLKLTAGGDIAPGSILALSEAQMRACGLSRQKLTYIRDLATRTLQGEIQFQDLPNMSDAEVIEHLTRVKGIGVWSAQMFLMFALRRENVMPTGDLGIRTAIKRAYRKRKLPLPKDMLKLARKWQPYCSIACYYLWRSLDNE